MPIAVQMKDIDARLLELLQEEVRALILELGLLSQGPEAPPVKCPRCVIEVAPGVEKGGAMASGCWHRGLSSPEPGHRRGRVGHSQVIVGIMLMGHQEGQGIIGLEADGRVSDARLWG